MNLMQSLRVLASVHSSLFKELYDLNNGYMVDETCVLKADFTIYGDEFVESSKCMSEETNV